MEHYATAAQVYIAGLVFARVGAMVMLAPGLGETAAPARVRLGLALLLTMVIAPIVAPTLPPVPGDISGLALAVGKETLLGLMMGAVLRLFLSALATAGEIISIQTTLSFAQTVNPSLGQQNSSLASFLALLGVLLIFTSNMHHMFIGAMIHSYQLFPFTRPLPVADSAMLEIRTFSGAFTLGVQLAAPILVFSLVFNLATGLIGRAMPQFQIFFAATPLQVILGLSLFALSLGTIGMVWVDHYKQLLQVFL
ncbi:MAG: flagellar biosynthetic protein FliR [Caulobacteraceae bacterium]